jgi:CBS domain containing-hemolysin-like protein
MEALGKMQRTGASRLLVTDGDRLVGIVSLKDLLGFLNLKLELKGRDDIAPQNGDSGSGRAREGAIVHH